MLHEQIESDLISALKGADKEKAGVLRLVISAIKNLQIEKKIVEEGHLSDEEVLRVLGRQAKQRKDSIYEYEKGGRADLADKEKNELRIIAEYMPAQMSEEDVEKVVAAKIAELGIADKSGFGKLMGAAMKELGGKADGDLVKKIVEKHLK